MGVVVATRVLVTGGAGFIGSHLVRRLRKAGHTVAVLDDFSSGQRTLPRDVNVFEGDVRDGALVRAAVRSQEAVFHLAAVVGVPHAMHRQWDSLTTNILGTAQLLSAIDGSEVPLVLVSSSAIYGKMPRVPVAEDDDVLLGNTHVASWTYSYAKLAEELLVRAAGSERGALVKIVRLFNVIGPGQTGRYGMVVPRFIAQALAGEPLQVYGDGQQTRTFVDIRDAVNGMLLVWERGARGEVYNIGGKSEVRIADLARRIIALTGSSSTVRYVPYRDAFGAEFEEPLRRIPNIGRIQALGYRPGVGLDDSLRAVAAWQRSSGGSRASGVASLGEVGRPGKRGGASAARGGGDAPATDGGCGS